MADIEMGTLDNKPPQPVCLMFVHVVCSTELHIPPHKISGVDYSLWKSSGTGPFYYCFQMWAPNCIIHNMKDHMMVILNITLFMTLHNQISLRC